MNRKNILSLAAIIIATLLLAFLGLYLVTHNYLSLREQQLLNRAVIDCLKNSGTVSTSEPANVRSVTQPIKEIYQFCLQDMGYSTQWK